MEDTAAKKLLDVAIENVGGKISVYKRQAKLILMFMLITVLAFVLYIIFDRIYDYTSLLNALEYFKATDGDLLPAPNSGGEYFIFGGFILIFSILSAFYRFFLREISKLEHNELGFIRIRIAANNSKTGFEDYVKLSLTDNAFMMDSKSDLKGEGKLSSPIPGHPGGEITVQMLNEILSKLESNKKDK